MCTQMYTVVVVIVYIRSAIAASPMVDVDGDGSGRYFAKILDGDTLFTSLTFIHMLTHCDDEI